MEHHARRGSGAPGARRGPVPPLEPHRELALGEAAPGPGRDDSLSQGGVLLFRRPLLQQFPALEHRRRHRADQRCVQARGARELGLFGDPHGPADRGGGDRIPGRHRLDRGAPPRAPARPLRGHVRRVPRRGGSVREHLPSRRPGSLRASVSRDRSREGGARDRSAHGRPAWISESARGARRGLRRVHAGPDQPHLRPRPRRARAGGASFAHVLLPLRPDPGRAHLASHLAERNRRARGGRGGAVPDGGTDEGTGLQHSLPHLCDLRPDQSPGGAHLHLPDAAARDREADRAQ